MKRIKTRRNTLRDIRVFFFFVTPVENHSQNYRKTASENMIIDSWSTIARIIVILHDATPRSRDFVKIHRTYCNYFKWRRRCWRFQRYNGTTSVEFLEQPCGSLLGLLSNLTDRPFVWRVIPSGGLLFVHDIFTHPFGRRYPTRMTRFVDYEHLRTHLFACSTKIKIIIKYFNAI